MLFFMILLWVLLFTSVISLPFAIYSSDLDEDSAGRRKKLWAIPIGLFLLIFLCSSFAIVPAGHRGVLLRFGKVEAVYNEGLNGKIPIIDKVVNMSVQTQLY